MKTNYIMILLVCLSQLLTAQTLKIYKTDNNTLDFNLSDVDSISFSTSPNGNSIIASNWNCFAYNPLLTKVESSSGIYEEVEDGLKVYGTSTNNIVQLIPAFQSSIKLNTIYLKWKVVGSGYPVNIGVELYDNPDNFTPAVNALSLSTNSGLIKDNIWYYTRISIVTGKITSITSRNNYDNNGGEVVAKSSSIINKDVETFSFQTNTSKSSYSILAESRIE